MDLRALYDRAAARYPTVLVVDDPRRGPVDQGADPPPPTHVLRYWRIRPTPTGLRTGRVQWHLTVLLSCDREGS